MSKKKPTSSPFSSLSHYRWPQSTSFNFLILTILTIIFFRQVFIHPSQMLWGNDIARAHSVYKQVQWQSFWNWGHFPLWDPTVFCGKSIVGDPLPALLNPLAFIFWLTPSPVLFGFYMCLMVIVSSWGMFLFCRRVGCDALGALIAAISFALSGKTAGHLFAGHVELLSTALGLPWILWSVEILVQKKTVSSVLRLGLVTAVVATLGSVQLVYWHLLFAMAYGIARSVSQSESGRWRLSVKPVLLLIAGMACFALAGAAWWFPIVRQTLLLSARQQTTDYAFATMNSALPPDLLRFLWPFSGIPSPQPFLSDPQLKFFWESSSYPGITALCLALAALICLWKNPHVIILGGLGVIALLLSLGSNGPLYWLAYHTVPGFALFRVPARLLFYTNFSVAVLAGLMISHGMTARWRGVVAAIPCVLIEIAVMAPLMMKGSALVTSHGWWLPAAVTGILGPCAFFWAFKSIPDNLWRGIALSLLTLELAWVWHYSIWVVEPGKAIPANSAAEYLAKQHETEEFRVLDTVGLLDQQIAAKYGLEIITGYHPGIYAHHLDLYKKIWRHDESDIVEMVTHSPREIACPTILDLMNVRYLITSERLVGQGYTEVHRTEPGENSVPRYVYQRDSVLPRAYLVGKASLPPAGAMVIDALCYMKPKEECLVEDNPVDGKATFTELTVQRSSPSDLTVEFNTDEAGIAVISQSWHPDWRATDNGSAVEVRKVNHGQVAVAVAAGEHYLRVYYYPWDFYVGCGVSGLTLLFAMIFGVTQWILSRKKIAPVLA